MPADVALLDPESWTIWDYLIVGGILSVIMLAAGYVLGLWWQRWRDDRRA